MAELDVDLYFSFRSPWSYYAVTQLYDLQQEYTMRVNLLVVNPIYIRYNDFFDKGHEKWRPYFLTDLLRYCEYRGIPIGTPRPDPINVTLPADDPGHLVLGLNPLGIAACAAGRGLEFAREVSALIWSGQVDGWDQGEHMELAAARDRPELFYQRHDPEREALETLVRRVRARPGVSEALRLTKPSSRWT